MASVEVTRFFKAGKTPQLRCCPDTHGNNSKCSWGQMDLKHSKAIEHHRTLFFGMSFPANSFSAALDARYGKIDKVFD